MLVDSCTPKWASTTPCAYACNANYVLVGIGISCNNGVPTTQSCTPYTTQALSGSPSAAAFANDGSIFVSAASDAVYKVSGGTVTTFASGGFLSSTWGISIDNAQSLYVGIGNGIVKITSAGTQSILYQGALISTPRGHMIDASTNNLYVCSAGTNTVVKITPGGGASTWSTAVAVPEAITQDNNFNIYVAANSGNTIYKLTQASPNTANVYVTTTANSFITGLQFDSAGLLYGCFYQFSSIHVWNSAGTLVSVLSGGMFHPFGIMMSPVGNLIVPNVGLNSLTSFSVTNTACTVQAPANGFLGSCTTSWASITPCSFTCASGQSFFSLMIFMNLFCLCFSGWLFFVCLVCLLHLFLGAQHLFS